MGLPAALGKYFADAATSPRHGNTTDPAGVSAPVKLRLSRDVAIDRLDKAAAGVADAEDHDDDLQAARASLARVFWDYIDDPEVSTLAAATRQLGPRTPRALVADGRRVARR